MEKNKIVFITRSNNDAHIRNRILEFLDHGYDVDVYGFNRKNHKNLQNLPYKLNVLGTIEDKSYISRIALYIRSFYKLGKKYAVDNTLFYLDGLATALFFHYVNKRHRYIYEECDLVHTYTKAKSVLEMIDKSIIRK